VRIEDTRLADSLLASVAARLNAEVFFDKESLQAPVIWDKEIYRRIYHADLVIVMISADWAGGTSAGGRRIDNENDWVRREIEWSLGLDKTLIPILLDRSEIPKADTLPKSMKDLSRWQTYRFMSDQFAPHMDALCANIGRAAADILQRSEALRLVPTDVERPPETP
jgi:hypothetical protein